MTAATAVACGPDFPNNMLDRGDEALLTAPAADFVTELDRMQLVPTRFRAREPEDDYPSQTADCESADLAAALKRSDLSRAEIAKLRSAHELARARLKEFVLNTPGQPAPGLGPEESAPAPPMPKIELPPDLPPEFADYFEGALAWHNPAILDKAPAREAWQRVLALPPQERHFKSTWAAFMLGKCYEQAGQPEKAIEFYQQVRQLARTGFVDSAALAAASLGLEARVFLRQKQFARSLELYLEQLATGDSTAPLSLQLVAAKILRSDTAPEVLVQLAKNPRAQKVITAYLVSTRHQDCRFFDDETDGLASHWLQAVEKAGVHDVESAEKLALAAYQANEMDAAQRWIKRGPNSALAQWLQAKLLLRAGKTKQAGTLLARIARLLPLEAPDTNRLRRLDFKDSLLVARGYRLDWVPAGRQALGELGAFHLSRREYVPALDALLNAGFWMDAAYVAERVLTLNELKSYVDRSWPAAAASEPENSGQNEKLDHGWATDSSSPEFTRRNIRYLLARRLTRSIRGDEARPYYPAEWQPQFDLLATALRTGWDESQSAPVRGPALFEAAIITRTNGLELVGTEVEPDWAIYQGDFEEGVSCQARANGTNWSLIPDPDELRRASEHHADPEERFHYRYQAAFLGWEAAKLMPDNSDQTAYVLWRSGSWLKNRDCETADLFYKALVRRNRHTALGAEADRRRWFPLLDEQGNILPPVKPYLEQEPIQLQEEIPVPSMEPGETEPTPDPGPSVPPDPAPNGYSYLIHKGDSLASIVQACRAAGLDITLANLLEANSGLDGARLLVGQRILIPSTTSNSDREPEH